MVQKNDANKVQQNKTFQFCHYVMNLYWEDKKYSLRNICGRKDEGHINYQRACAHAETKHAGWETQSLKPSKALFSFERYRDKENTCLLSKIVQCLPFRCFVQDMYKYRLTEKVKLTLKALHSFWSVYMQHSMKLLANYETSIYNILRLTTHAAIKV